VTHAEEEYCLQKLG
jgi:hypothetical protein